MVIRNPVTSELVKELVSQLISPSTELVTPASSNYESAIARWSDTAIKRAGTVAFPLSADEVSKLLIFASKHQLEITVKGGGHSTGGTSATDGGLVIDLSKMRKVSVDPSKKIITAQGGALWSDVDEAAAEHDLATVGGTVNHTGIGGLTLGGGFGWLTGLYGAVVDNLVAATVVIANGQILHTSDTENSDLFWAIRGAGQNFGVVTEFQYKAYDQPNPVYAGQIIFTPDKLGSIIDVLNERKELGDPRAGFHCFFAVPPGAPGPLIMLICYYNGDEETAKKYLAPVLELQPVSRELQAIPYVKMNGLLNGMTSPGGRKALKGYTVPSKIRKEFAQWLLDEYTMKIKQEPEMVKSFIAIEYYALAKVAAVPVKATAFPTRGNLHAGLIGLGWDDPKKDEDVRAWGRYMQAKCREEIQNVDQINPSISIVYANYLEPGDLGSQSAFGVNQSRLAQLKSKYDPRFLFHKTNPIEPVKLA